MPQSARIATIVAAGLAEDSGVVEGGIPVLRDTLGHTDTWSTTLAVKQAEAWHYMARHIRVPKPADVFVVLARLRAGLCETCARPAKKMGGTTFSKCSTCLAGTGNPALAWRETALSVWAHGKASGLTEAQIVYRASRACKIDVYGDREESGHGYNAQSIVGFYLAERLISPEWRTWQSRAHAGHSEEEW